MAHKGVRDSVEHFTNEFWPTAPGATPPLFPAKAAFQKIQELTPESPENEVADAFVSDYPCRSAASSMI